MAARVPSLHLVMALRLVVVPRRLVVPLRRAKARRTGEDPAHAALRLAGGREANLDVRWHRRTTDTRAGSTFRVPVAGTPDIRRTVGRLAPDGRERRVRRG